MSDRGIDGMVVLIMLCFLAIMGLFALEGDWGAVAVWFLFAVSMLTMIWIGEGARRKP